MFGFLQGRKSHDPPPVDIPVPPTRDPAVDELLARCTSIELHLESLLKTEEQACARELAWSDMNAQLRRFLGRLDAHAGQDRRRAEEENPRAAQLSEVLRLKFPNGVPTRG